MKQKTRTCSTGHDTGVLQRRGLHESMEADRVQRRSEKLRRLTAQLAKFQRHGKKQGPGGVIEEVNDGQGSQDSEATHVQEVR